METSQKGITLIKNFEGCRLTAYKCAAGVWTIGYGHTGKVDGKNVGFGMKISQAKADALLKEDLKRYENYVNATKLKLNQNQFDALVSFTYNCGSGCLQTLVKNRNLKQIGDALSKYNKAGGKVLQGLVKRRKAEQDLFFTSVETKEVENKVENVVINTVLEKQEKKGDLPYDVKTVCKLNVRAAAGTNYPIIRTAKKGEILTIWAEMSSGGKRWGKNGNEFYCLEYCERV